MTPQTFFRKLSLKRPMAHVVPRILQLRLEKKHLLKKKSIGEITQHVFSLLEELFSPKNLYLALMLGSIDCRNDKVNSKNLCAYQDLSPILAIAWYDTS